MINNIDNYQKKIKLYSVAKLEITIVSGNTLWAY